MATKTVYSFDPRTFAYVCTEVAHESPLEPGEWHVPAHATEISPPEIPIGYACKWTGRSWVLQRRYADRTAIDARRDAMRRIARYTDAMVEACYAQEDAFREQLQSMPNDVEALDAFDPASARVI